MDNLIDGRAAIHRAQHEFHHFKVMQSGLSLEAVEVGVFADQNVLTVDCLQGFGRKDQIHRVACLGGKINVEPS